MNYTLNGIEYTLRDWQARCYNEHKDTKKILLTVGTGLGKTLMALILADKYQGKKLVICIKKKKKDWIRDTAGLDYVVMTRDEIYTQPIPDDIVCIIQDEIHEIVSNVTSTRFKVLYQFFARNMHIPHIILSATPIRSSWTSLFAYYCLLGLAHPVVDYKKWQSTFQFLGKQWMKNAQGKAMERRCWKNRTDKETLEKLQRGVQKISFMYFEDNPNARYETVKVSIPLEFPITDTEPTSHDFYRLENRHPNKIAKLKELVIPGTVIVCFYKEEVVFLKDLFKCNAVSGKDEYHDGLRDEPIVVCQMQSTTGYELPRHKRMVFFSYSYGFVNYKQSHGRIDRGNMPEVEYIYMETFYTDTTHKTMDQNVRVSLQKGKSYDVTLWQPPQKRLAL
jgi:hypothetical protein